MSQGEQLICSLLNKAGLYYEREKHFSDLREGKFRYDFYITLHNGQKVLLEFNGTQHYKYVSKFYKSKSEWRKAQEYDRRKISYALANDIPLYIIPYWDLSTLRYAADLFQPQYLTKTRWHNDQVYFNKKDR